MPKSSSSYNSYKIRKLRRHNSSLHNDYRKLRNKYKEVDQNCHGKMKDLERNIRNVKK